MKTEKDSMNKSYNPVILIIMMVVLSGATLSHGGSLDQAKRLYEQNQIDSADSLLEILWQQDDRNAETAFYLGRIAFVRNEFKDAVRWFETAEGIADTSAQYHYWQGNAYGIQAMDAGILDRVNLAKKTRSEYERAAEMDPDDLGSRWGLLQYFTMALGIMGGGDAKAMEQARMIQSLNPVQGVYAFAYFYTRKGKTEQAKAVYEKGIQSEPHEIGFYPALYQIHMEEKNYERALELIRRFIAVNPQHTVDAWLYQVYVYQEKKEYVTAMTFLDSILTREPDHWMALYQAGRTAAFSGQFTDRGIRSLERYLGHTPGENEPQHADAYFRLGQIYESKGQKVPAENAYQRSLNLDPNHKEAKKALKNLR
jgi:tetratricopeptide (TPR) repeat protein